MIEKTKEELLSKPTEEVEIDSEEVETISEEIGTDSEEVGIDTEEVEQVDKADEDPSAETDESEDGEIPEPAEPFIEDDGRAWFVVHCYSGYENKVRHSIEQRIESMGMQSKIFDVVVPTEEEMGSAGQLSAEYFLDISLCS